MCDICRQHPCHPRCPNAKEPRYIDQCILCGRWIEYEEEHFDDNGVCMCMECYRETEDDLK